MDVASSDRRPERYAVLGVIFTVIFIVCIVAFTYRDDGAMALVWDAVGGYTFFGIFAALPMIYFLYYTQHWWRLRREFHQLMDTRSKARFLTNIDRIEFLAWKLGPPYAGAVRAKREEFRIKRLR